ncbi:MAG: hypothetical protein ABSF71_06510 [Terriglobia bacterium]
MIDIQSPMTPIRKPFDFRRRPPYPHRPKKPVTQEKKVTVCLAIACDCYTPDTNPKYVVVTDQMVSTGTSSSLSRKMWSLTKSWYAMISGNDVSLVSNVLAASWPEISKIESPTAADVSRITKTAYQARRTSQLEDMYLAAYDLDMSEFMKEGRKLLGASIFEQMKFQMDQYDLGFNLLVCGFDSAKAQFPTLFEVTNPGIITPRTVPGYYAGIGAGAANSLSYLDWKKQSQRTSLEQTLYNGIAAKSLAESALGVSKETTVTVVERAPSSSERTLKEEQIQRIREIWEKEEASIRPPNLESRIIEILKSEPSTT